MTEIEYTYDTGDGQSFKGSMPIDVAREIAERAESVEIADGTALVGGRYRFPADELGAEPRKPARRRAKRKA